jgi:hypothetical protein
MGITKSEFQAYVRVQKSGATNMFDVRTVGALSGLSREQILEIMRTYKTLSIKYPDITNK